MRGASLWSDEANPPSTSTPRIPPPSHSSRRCRRIGNVFQHVALRQVSPRTAYLSKSSIRETCKCELDSSGPRRDQATSPRHGLLSWAESESLRYLSANYCALLPPPRSTIAAAFSPDGKTLASTHGDHTVKIIDCQTGECLKVLHGHRRTPWVVRFHPQCSDLLASGSLDHEVRLWDAKTAECIDSRDFFRPIASIAFHAQGELLAVASGHKLYIWHYNRSGETSSPVVVLKTRRSLRAVHFHPHASPFLLTAEVSDFDSSDPSITLATSQGYLHYPPPTLYLADAHSTERSTADRLPLAALPLGIWPSISSDNRRESTRRTDTDGNSSGVQSIVDPSTSVRLLTYSTPSGQYELLLSPIGPNSSSPTSEDTGVTLYSTEIESELSQTGTNASEPMEAQPVRRANSGFPFGVPTYWELPFLQGWLMGQTHTGQRGLQPPNTVAQENYSEQNELGTNQNIPSLVSNSASQSRVTGRSGSRHCSSHSHPIPVTGSNSGTGLSNAVHGEGHPPPVINRIQSELVTSLAAAAAPELPCTVKLRLWVHDVKNPCVALERCRLTIPHAVLCSEMGAHFSPCGRLLAACVACILPHLEPEPGLHSQVNHEVSGIATSPTRHPLSAHQVVYELRIYSLEEATFGSVLASRAIRAAHCLTSIQFSPTSEHILLAYGRRHSSLLKSVVIDGEATVPSYTILEVYRVSDMELVRVLPSAEDEVNVACFHPSAGGGIVYGTKEGKLRILQYDRSHNAISTTHGFLDENMSEVPTHALEC